VRLEVRSCSRNANRCARGHLRGCVAAPHNTPTHALLAQERTSPRPLLYLLAGIAKFAHGTRIYPLEVFWATERFSVCGTGILGKAQCLGFALLMTPATKVPDWALPEATKEALDEAKTMLAAWPSLDREGRRTSVESARLINPSRSGLSPRESSSRSIRRRYSSVFPCSVNVKLNPLSTCHRSLQRDESSKNG